jgi:hypothetical protein
MFFSHLRGFPGSLLVAKQPSFYIRGYFLLLLLIGLLLYKDYGVSWDEPIDRVNGMVSAKYVANLISPEWVANRAAFSGVPDIHGYRENDHGVMFEMPLSFLDQGIEISDSRTYYLLRHFIVFLIFMAGTWAVYNLGRIRFRSWKFGLLLSTLLVLSPRFFAESFYNDKDVGLLAVFAFGIYTLVRLLERPSLRRAAVHGLVTAAAVDIRILGIMLIAFTLGMVALELLFGPPTRQARLQLAKTVSVYLLVAVAGIILFWPYLWEAPLDNFLTAFDNMKKFRWYGEVLYLGDKVPTLKLPWHYAPVWITVTTPIAYTAAFVLGIVGAIYGLLRYNIAYLRTFEGRLDILFMGWFCLPIIMVIVLHSVIYDGWRHLYFVYPGLLMLAGRGAWELWQAGRRHQWLRPVAIGAATLAGGEMVYTVVQMVQAHPQEQVYFSCLSGPDAERLFERDYWGLSYREGLEWILQHDPAPQLNVTCQNAGLLETNLAIMKPEDRVRFRVGGQGKEQYFLSAYRTHPEPYSAEVGNEVYSIHAFKLKVLSVFYRW